MKEIGSEFWNIQTNINNREKLADDYIFMLSGRTALEFIIRNIKEEKAFHTVYMPSYCCDSMVEPFLHHGIQVIFYDVLVSQCGGLEFQIDYDMECDAIYLIQYFGYQDNQAEGIAKKFKARGITIIEDITHSLFNEVPYSAYTNYAFGSLRKWTALSTGGFAAKIYGDFVLETPKQTNERFYQLRKHAAELKSDYMKGEIDSKEEFLRLFHEAEENLERDYCNYSMDEYSVSELEHFDLQDSKQKRRRNANILLKAISNNGLLNPIYKISTDQDTPLFVPVIINYGMRDKFRNYLIENRIYCPVHWKISGLYDISDKAKEIYRTELSLVCDQRYSEQDMQHFAEIINEFRV